MIPVLDNLLFTPCDMNKFLTFSKNYTQFCGRIFFLIVILFALYSNAKACDNAAFFENFVY